MITIAAALAPAGPSQGRRLSNACEGSQGTRAGEPCAVSKSITTTMMTTVTAPAMMAACTRLASIQAGSDAHVTGILNRIDDLWTTAVLTSIPHIRRRQFKSSAHALRYVSRLTGGFRREPTSRALGRNGVFWSLAAAPATILNGSYRFRLPESGRAEILSNYVIKIGRIVESDSHGSDVMSAVVVEIATVARH